MSRKLFVVFAAFALVAVFFVSRAPAVEAQSSGCSAFAGAMNGVLREGPGPAVDSLKTFGPIEFQAGEVIQISAREAGTATPYPNITLSVTGNTGGTSTQSGAVLGYTIPSTQLYYVAIQNDFGVDADIAASCGGAGSPAPQWSGLSDGRLNADPAENYSIFCGPGYVDVYVTVSGQGALLARISQNDLAVLREGQNRQVPTNNGPLIVTRGGPTFFSFAGNNGNRSPEFGQKDVDLAPCGLSLPVAPPVLPTIAITYGAATPTPGPDLDNDGVVGTADLCPNYRPFAAVYPAVRGCADTDRDGFVNPYMGNPQTYVLDDSNPEVPNFIDECPTVFGQGDNGNGCPDVASATTVTVSTPVITTDTQTQTLFDAIFPAFSADEWVSVSLAGQSDACVADQSSTTTTTYIAVQLCEARVYFTPNTPRPRYRGPGTEFGTYEGAPIPNGARLLAKERNFDASWIRVTYDLWYSGWIPTANGSFDNDINYIPLQGS